MADKRSRTPPAPYHASSDVTGSDDPLVSLRQDHDPSTQQYTTRTPPKPPEIPSPRPSPIRPVRGLYSLTRWLFDPGQWGRSSDESDS